MGTSHRNWEGDDDIRREENTGVLVSVCRALLADGAILRIQVLGPVLLRIVPGQHLDVMGAALGSSAESDRR
jgi:hypothetical protein